MHNGFPVAPSFEDYIKSVSMFFVDEQLEEAFETEVESGIESFRSKMLGISTRDGMEKFIRSQKDAIEKLISLLDISEEKFKRIVTMLRIRRGYLPQGDWTPSAVRENMLREPYWMDEICDLFMNGATSQKYRGLIPKFYASNFQINATTLGRLANKDDVRRLIKKSLGGRYSNKIGDGFFDRVAALVKSTCAGLGVDFQVKTVVPWLGERVDVAIPNAEHPKVIVKAIYTITTSSIQTNYAKKAEAIRARIRAGDRQENVVYVNIVDGGGWVARQSDLNRIYGCSDYLLNMKTLNVLQEIIEAVFKQEAD